MSTQLAFDPKLCTECRTCELMCSFVHLQVFNRGKSGIRITSAWPGAPAAALCRRCDDHPCVQE
ncbi:MAG TPA: 4Fe-4S dicluster domain-containing protein, partial [Bacillota bacterium]